VTHGALRKFLQDIEEKQVAPEDLDHTLREIAKHYNDLHQKLQLLSSDDPAVDALRQQAKAALEAVRFEEAEVLLNQACDRDLEAARQLEEIAQERFLSAAASKAANGELKYTQLAYAEAAVYYRQAAELVPNSAQAVLADYLNQFGRALDEAGDYRNAQGPLARALAIREQVLGPHHPNVATSLNNLAALYDAQGKYAEAEPLYQRALKISEAALGPHHPNVATSLNNLAVLYYAQGKAQIIPTLRPYANLAALYDAQAFYDAQGKYAEAEPLYQRALKIREAALGPHHPNTITVYNLRLPLTVDGLRSTVSGLS
jgi:tetratricopeptide (TPR) repeat protein